MALRKQFTLILWLVFLFPISSYSKNSNQYGATYDYTLPVKPVSYVLELTNVTEKIFSLRGVVSAQCQGDACWFMIKDDTGEVLVDLKPYDFRTPLGIVGKKVKLNGQAYFQEGKIQVNAISVIIIE
jgi:uncharacterized protein YdeI (BOF family)